MVKLVGAVLTAFACGCLGFCMSAMLKTRMTSLFDIVTSLEMLESEINFSINRLKKAFERADKNGLFKSAAEKIDENGIKKAWESAVEEHCGRLCITDEDKDILLMLGKNLGKTDTDDQIKNIKYIKTMIASQAKLAEEEYNRLGKLYRNGGVLVGAMAVIILI